MGTSLKGFSQDKHLKKLFKDLIEEFSIKTVIETGTYQGATTEELAKMVDSVLTIESNAKYFEASKKKLEKYDNVLCCKGNSGIGLKQVIAHPNVKHPLLIFLDAHWYAYNPLLDELKWIWKSGHKPVIVIHDFKVPNKDFGYDTYGKGANKIVYDWAYIAPSIRRIYGNDFTYYYNKKADPPHKRGVIVIHKK